MHHHRRRLAGLLAAATLSAAAGPASPQRYAYVAEEAWFSYDASPHVPSVLGVRAAPQGRVTVTVPRNGRLRLRIDDAVPGGRVRVRVAQGPTAGAARCVPVGRVSTIRGLAPGPSVVTLLVSESALTCGRAATAGVLTIDP